MMELVEEHFSLDNKVGDILKGFAPTAHQKMIELEYNIDSHVPNCIRADETRISQMIFNVVGNAVKFTETGEVIQNNLTQYGDIKLPSIIGLICKNIVSKTRTRVWKKHPNLTPKQWLENILGITPTLEGT